MFFLYFPVSTVNLILSYIYMYDPFLAENHLFQNKTFLHDTFLLVSSYFPTHPITLLLKLLGDECMGRPSTSNFGGPSLPVPLSLRPHEACVNIRAVYVVVELLALE